MLLFLPQLLHHDKKAFIKAYFLLPPIFSKKGVSIGPGHTAVTTILPFCSAPNALAKESTCFRSSIHCKPRLRHKCKATERHKIRLLLFTIRKTKTYKCQSVLYSLILSSDKVALQQYLLLFFEFPFLHFLPKF